jgi:EmrB/QacA subfamily drug resistance transporter
MAFIDSTVVNVALPALQTAFHATLVDVQWVVESYALLLGALILVGGSVGDLYGRRRIFLIGVFIFAIGSAWCGFARSIHELIYARSLQGFGAAFLVPGSLAIISASFDEKNRGKAIGTWSGFTAITMAVGPVLGGWLIEHASWRWAFLINLPIAAAVIFISLWRVPESRSRQARELDLAGAVLVTLGLGALVYGLTESARLGWTDLRVIATLIVGAISLIAFPVLESRSPSPMLPLELFRSSTFTGANLLTLFLYAAFSIFFFLFPLNLIQVQGYTATAAGAAALPLILLIFLLSRWSGGLVDRYGPRLPLIVGPIIVALGFTLFALTSVSTSYWRSFFGPYLVLGFGMSVSVAPLTTVVMNAVDRDHAGIASGINNAVSRIAGLLAIAVLGVLVVHSFGSHLDRELARLDLPQPLRSALNDQRISLAAITIPDEVDPRLVPEIKRSVANSFLHAFRQILFLCAALALLSAFQTVLWIRPSTEGPSVG